jgi:glycosyltransferase involved in cell wall biosynthesis
VRAMRAVDHGPRVQDVSSRTRAGIAGLAWDQDVVDNPLEFVERYGAPMAVRQSCQHTRTSPTPKFRKVQLNSKTSGIHGRMRRERFTELHVVNSDDFPGNDNQNCGGHLNDISLLAYPMHGHAKMLSEGYRTRDGHLIEWLGRRAPAGTPVRVVSRPEPLAKRVLDRVRSPARSENAPNTTYADKTLLRLPNLTNRYRWWPDSAMHYPSISDDLAEVAAIVWNPFIGSANIRRDLFNTRRTVVADLLDDWTIHYSFQGIKSQVDEAYRGLFAGASFVTANSEGTLDLARRYGRSDAVLVANGCDPERFSTKSRASGPITVGYVGKLGKRINDALIVSACAALPDVNFVIAGPVLDGDLDKQLAGFPNCTLLGDVHYDKVPALLETFDIGWVPHNTGAGEVGGDVIKTYEYRAAGLPVLTTPIAGVTARGLAEVHVVEADEQVEWMKRFFGNLSRIERVVSGIPEDATWEFKSNQVKELLGVNW